MNRVHYGRKRWRTRWPWSWLFPLRVDDRFCAKCGLPYHNGPLPKELKQLTSGHVSALIYPAGGWKRNTLAVRFGRWKTGAQLFLSEYIAAEELDDLLEVAAQAREFVGGRTRAARR